MSDTGSPGGYSTSAVWRNFLASLCEYQCSDAVFCFEQGCSEGGERCWTHQWLMCVEKRTWLGGGPEETVSSWSTNGSWRKWSSCMRWVIKISDLTCPSCPLLLAHGPNATWPYLCRSSRWRRPATYCCWGRNWATQIQLPPPNPWVSCCHQAWARGPCPPPHPFPHRSPAPPLKVPSHPARAAATTQPT